MDLVGIGRCWILTIPLEWTIMLKFDVAMWLVVCNGMRVQDTGTRNRVDNERQER